VPKAPAGGDILDTEMDLGLEVTPCTLMVFGTLGVLKAPQVALEGWFGASVVGASVVGADFQTVLSFVGMGMFMFLGLEFVTPLTPELKNAQRTIPRAMFIGLCLVALCMTLWRWTPRVD
jgi:amino acid transporter